MATLSDMSTKELMRALRGNDYFDSIANVEVYVGKRLITGGVEQHITALVADVRAELAKRPHLPNKQEGRIIHRIRSNTGLTEEQIRATPKYQEELADAQYPNRREMTATQAKLVSQCYGKWFNRLFKVVKNG